MDLLIHDLNPEEWNKVKEDYEGWIVVTDDGAINPCIGCFSCWNRDPGVCAIKDGFSNMGYLVHHADEVAVISRYTYGGFSGTVKCVIDRCLGYVLPQFEVIKGETHHMKRYEEDKPFTFIFYGHDLSDEDKDAAIRYVKAVCANFRCIMKDVIFRESGEPAEAEKKICANDGKVMLLNGSMRSVSGNSAKLARRLAGRLGMETEITNLKDHMDDIPVLLDKMSRAETLVLCVPLYVDGLPGKVIGLLEKFQKEYDGAGKKVYLLTNMGLYESRQLVNLFEAVKQWCTEANLEYCGGLGVSAGELLGALMETLPYGTGPMKKADSGMDRLAEAIECGGETEDIYTEPYRFPRKLYISIANSSWNKSARKNGIRPEDMYRRL